ncbi:hypothetical protein AMTRI_Chr07g26290 [Amborella trichopoda]|uniref:Core Histone H2A/H2B/H3 domain-containing protein n=1 Tax=Amborella trichopoda TaxID=13333 RepID=U5D2T5_AMBTC|nr:nuclear transcription factor Y subunit C-2 [Amborella trichopoda]ERN15727.1 hypothetical protein AMTR_s00039p00040000 [Amborella trichopoda]|eukprot:XP_006854260.1 nuclear transcription factor Y subunit C-2 [Amborella trichopoda]
MDHQQGQGQQPPPVMGMVTGAPPPMPYPSYQTSQVVGATSAGPGSPLGQVGPAQFGTSAPHLQHPLAYQHLQHQQQAQQAHQLQLFWANQLQEIEQTTDFKNHSLPLARIKKIMKADEDVRMISAEAPVVFAKACEMFILELTLRSWIHTEENKRRTLQKNDIAAAITRTDIFDFLVDIVPRDELKDEVIAAGLPRPAGPGLAVGGPPTDAMPYYYMPAQAPPPNVATMVGRPVGEQGLYGQQPRPFVGQQVWPTQPNQQQQQVPEQGRGNSG